MSNTHKGEADPVPYSSTPIFDETSLPDALRNRHDTKEGVWGHIRVIEGQLKLTILDPAGSAHLEEIIVEPGSPGVVLPCQPHFVTPIGAMQMQVDFYKEPPPG
ncbi:DUF1971 domain-containing protein [Croceicoccus sp. F390]|uniref:DUF1971 domain-containing protein n=1 Tax=Croceicoccus esteveae TaxID=3075597 RepID=A0ABU2ZGZ0_9SPHN|nr:DUF1971 domain-containing protein [Croceicoccus sp. F390]MDT0575855.1 DUF1971 domain-containing protein [Croceicoccus sp. F390]